MLGSYLYDLRQLVEVLKKSNDLKLIDQQISSKFFGYIVKVEDNRIVQVLSKGKDYISLIEDLEPFNRYPEIIEKSNSKYPTKLKTLDGYACQGYTFLHIARVPKDYPFPNSLLPYFLNEKGQKNFESKLPLFPVVNAQDAQIKIVRSLHKFTEQAKESGEDFPIFGSVSNMGTTDYGLPILNMIRGQSCNVEVTMEDPNYWTNLHYHGLDDDPYFDGASMECLFGEQTVIGKTFKGKLQCTNNGSVCWYHCHNMLGSGPFVYGGLFGINLISDVNCAKIDEYFSPNQNDLFLVMADYNFNEEDSTVDASNIYNGTISYLTCNGIAVAGINKNKLKCNPLYHISPSNHVKINLLNGTNGFRRYYIGVTDRYKQLRYFHLVATDQGYRSPYKTLMASMSPGNRIGIYLNLDDFPKNEAYIFFYEYDWTKVNTGFPVGSQKVNGYRFLKIILEGVINYDNVLSKIDDLVLIDKNNEIDYCKRLNWNYFYNLPDFGTDLPVRKIFLFNDEKVSLDNGATEYINVGRIFVDCHNSKESESSVLFKIFEKTKEYDQYAAYCCTYNDELSISVGEEGGEKEYTINFKKSEQPYTSKQWSELVNAKLNGLIEYKLEVIDFKVMNDTIKSLKISLVNKSDRRIKLKARWSLLQFFGKPFTASSKKGGACCSHLKHTGHMQHDKMSSSVNQQEFFVFAGNANGELEYPDEDDRFTITIDANSTYVGFLDGFMNDNLLNFSAKKETSEKWVYTNFDSFFHPFHFHLTSGFVSEDDPENYWIKDLELEYLKYSNDVYAIPGGKTIAIRVKFPYHSCEEGEVPHLGYMYHCHFMEHHDMNMMGQFYIYA